MTIRVLIADDHAVMRDGLQALFHATGDIRVVAAVANGREALRAARELTPDVALLDLAMPELNGLEAARRLREECPEVRVVILSMHSTAEYVHRARQAGAAGYILKESAGVEVIDAVRRVHAGRHYFSRALWPALMGTGYSATQASPLESLSRREREVLQLVVEGKTSAETAATLHLSPKSVDTYRSRLMTKLGVGDIPALVKFAIRHGLTPP